jgi:hypothetical protein
VCLVVSEPYQVSLYLAIAPWRLRLCDNRVCRLFRIFLAEKRKGAVLQRRGQAGLGTGGSVHALQASENVTEVAHQDGQIFDLKVEGFEQSAVEQFLPRC